MNFSRLGTVSLAYYGQVFTAGVIRPPGWVDWLLERGNQFVLRGDHCNQATFIAAQLVGSTSLY